MITHLSDLKYEKYNFDRNVTNVPQKECKKTLCVPRVGHDVANMF